MTDGAEGLERTASLPQAEWEKVDVTGVLLRDSSSVVVWSSSSESVHPVLRTCMKEVSLDPLE